MNDPIHVTDGEAELLKALWRCGPLPPAALYLEVQRQRPWGVATIKTLLARLMHKQAIRAERQGARLAYHATITRDALVAQEVDDLVRRLFDGDASRLAQFLATGRVAE